MKNPANLLNLKKSIKLIVCHLFVLVGLTLAVHAQDYDNPETVIAEAQGQQLKMKHIVAYMGMKMAMNQMPQHPTEAQTEAVAGEAIMVFNASPVATIQQLDAVAAELGLNGGAAPQRGSPTPNHTGGHAAGGYAQNNHGSPFNMEQELAKFGPNQLDFHSPTANQLKQLLTGTLLIDRSSSFSSSGGSSHYSSSSSKVHFCPNGTFAWVSDASISIDVPGMYAGSQGGNDAPVTGYWDVATAGGVTMIMLYSQHPEMLELNPNGFIPMPVNSFQADLIAVPNVNSKTGQDLYSVNRGQAQCY